MALNESFSNRRCFNHAEREAVARCPECKKEFCRECITEHKGRMLCTNCLKKCLAEKSSKRSLLRVAVIFSLMLAGFLITYGFFYEIASILSEIPSSSKILGVGE